ncbi:hypothetical protein IWW50_005358, partial [Coemansia erecta]
MAEDGNTEQQHSQPIAPGGLTLEQQTRVARARAFAQELQETTFKDIALAEQQRRTVEAQPTPGTVNPGLLSGVDARNISVLSRVYVGSINFELTEEHMQRVFGEFGTVRSVSMSRDAMTGRHKGFGFVEFYVPEAASLAIDVMDGMALGGRALRLGRPNNYAVTVAQGFPAPPAERIYVANVSTQVSEHVLREIFAPFGDVTACVLAPDMGTRMHRGWGFVEFARADAAAQAAQAMNGLELGGLALRVRPSVVGGPLGDGMAALAASGADALDPPNAGHTLNPPNAGHTTDPSTADHTTDPSTADHTMSDADGGSTVVLLSNVVGGRTDVDDDLASDMAGEGTKCGAIVKVVVHIASEAEMADLHEVCVFLEYADSGAAARALELFDGRWFGGRRVAATPFDPDRFRVLTSSDTMVFIP